MKSTPQDQTKGKEDCSSLGPRWVPLDDENLSISSAGAAMLLCCTKYLSYVPEEEIGSASYGGKERRGKEIGEVGDVKSHLDG